MKTKFELEYTFNTSPKVLYPRFSTAGGLSEWFADDVHVNGKIFTFIWKRYAPVTYPDKRSSTQH